MAKEKSKVAVIRTILVYLWAALIIVGALPYLAYENHRKKKGDLVSVLKDMDHLVSWFAGSIVDLCGSKVTVVGAENLPPEDQAVVYVANHQSNFDIPVAVKYIPQTKVFVVKEELKKIPFFDCWIRGIGCIYIARGDGRKALESILASVKMVKSGMSVMIFPEGTRSQDGTLGEFKAGALKVASKANAAVVPIVFDGTKDVMPKGKKLFYNRPVTMTILPPIPAEEVKAMATNDLADKVKQQIAQTLGQSFEPLAEGALEA